ncbi:putative ELP3 family histone acetyltransferase [Cafeteria roenbergensis virus]|uniref:tRNA carboxymethyluridine synthase n=1 Tax=Cafeteria roenbergensis virus (strain BV-PW1) TaxID=693272 RepID=E3T5G2_CROVB|nr:putative ELP3 family histone acetyltransferase [Cafeteria roenbergensis virus BV-PW1]ADO67425.1 putative ELP3 family histone acetyltransferase [Cafeteria roenbergensis virus BV-PW1]
MSIDIEDLRIQPIHMPDITQNVSVVELTKIDNIIYQLYENPEKNIAELSRENKLNIPHITYLHRYHQLVDQGKLKENSILEFKLMIKKGRGHSGVEVIAVSTYPEGKYVGCPADCHYCPKEPSKDFKVCVKNVSFKKEYVLIEITSVNEEDYYYAKVIGNIKWDKKEISPLTVFTLKKSVILQFHRSQFKSVPSEGVILDVHKTAQPRSYLSSEPAVARANQNGWDCVAQFREIAGKRIKCGHNVTKVEGIVLGGTWSYYPKDYQIKFIRDFYYAANTLYAELPLRPKQSMKEEIKLNETTRCRIIGLTLETRPDFITPKEITILRSYGCTRVQLGIQHINDDILNYINRGCKHSKSVRAIKLLKNAGFKVDIHLMPDLPSSNFWEDVRMFEHVLSHEELQADQWKIYPCQTLDHSKIKEWYEDGSYKPYFEQKKIINFDNIYWDHFYKQTRDVYMLAVPTIILQLIMYYFNQDNFEILLLAVIPISMIIGKFILDMMASHYVSNPLFHQLIHFIPKVHPWIRLNRVVRDNPKHAIVGGLDQSHYRNLIEDRLKITNNLSQDIREREIKGRKYDPSAVNLIIRSYQGSGSTEYFVSFEDTKNNYLLGFIRLRIPPKTTCHYLSELNNSALIRELHVYGSMVPQGSKKTLVQHRGFGQRLVKKAEEIALSCGYSKMAIISGVGVRKYYENKLGYKLEGTFMTKEL